ncbi:unnamed protein product [Echinostoma caproni]|uniref:Pecanex-like protein n=1 Tax=Echinostoma caproni TaxID=27848 RepID=A0A183BEH0_9TREM|nr:unnamed protein product [Echinostoma caproni]
MLSLNAALRMRCMTWQFIYGAYCVEGYRMTSHSADTVVQLNDLRKILVTRFVQRLTTLSPCLEANNFFAEYHLDLDPVFLRVIDDDYDDHVNGVTRRRFVHVYQSWIRYCLEKQALTDTVSCDSDSPLVTLCYALSIMGRRCMGGIQAANFDYYFETDDQNIPGHR